VRRFLKVISATGLGTRETYVMSASPNSPLGSEFNDFLFAPIGEDQNGLNLSVVSLLARMNLDPWEEAGNLATLPAQAAGKRLASSLESLTDPRLRQTICAATVMRLLALLPRRAPPAALTPVTGTDFSMPPHPGLHTRAIVFIAATIVLAGAQMFAAHRFAPTPPASGTGPAAQTAPSQTLPTTPRH
jgi:hypothetical protein